MSSHQGDPSVLGMINDNLNVISADLKDIQKELKKGAVQMENHNVRLKNIESDVRELTTGQKKIKKELFNHANNKKEHYNQGYKETVSQRMWRKKAEIIVAAIIGSATGIMALLASYGVI